MAPEFHHSYEITVWRHGLLIVVEGGGEVVLEAARHGGVLRTD